MPQLASLSWFFFTLVFIFVLFSCSVGFWWSSRRIITVMRRLRKVGFYFWMW